MELAGKIFLITGGTKGIGAATAIDLAKHGADIVINGRYEDDDGKQVIAAIEALGRKCKLAVADCAIPAEAKRCVSETVAAFGGIDGLVHMAGGPVNGKLFEITEEIWNQAFDIHVHAIFHLCRAAIPHMQKKKEGAIILCSSTAGKRGLPVHIAYQAVKGAIPNITRGLAREFAPDNIRINAVAPGVIRTRFHENMTPEQKKLNLEQRIPLQREGTAEQVATLITELIANDYITGETVTIDGGLTMRMP